WARRQNRSANRLLALSILAISVSSAYVLYLRTGFYERHPRWLFVIETLPALYGPAFYLYARALTGAASPRPWLHFVPFGLYTLIELPRFLMEPEDKLQTFLSEKLSGGSELQLAAALAFDVLGLCYLVAALLHVHGYRRSLAGRFSNFDRINLGWLKWLLLALTVLWLGSMIGYVSEHSLLVYVHLGLSIVIYAIAYRNVLQPQIQAGPIEEPVAVSASVGLNEAVAQDRRASDAPAAEPEPERISILDLQIPSLSGSEDAQPGPFKNLKTRLKPEQTQAVAQRIEQLFETERPYLDPDLALTVLAERLDIPPHQLSQVLNEHFAKSFYDFVNQYRVEELKRRLSDPAHASDKILRVGRDCGFTTHATLDANFRKHAGMTAREYRDQRQA
ncbi:MAG TPA: helix-turn-helix domain-containing protein, partial [Polyangiales bacterium]|nr:helix-turn-helix domain-containing protein [Polyangiales bacterium]